MIAAASSSTSSLGAGPSPRTSSTRPIRKIRRPPTMKGCIATQVTGLRSGGRKAGTIASASAADATTATPPRRRSEEHTSELQSQSNLVCRLLLEKKKKHKQKNKK